MRRTTVAALAVALAVAVLAGCGPASSPSRFGVNVGSGGDVAADRMKEAGFKWARVFMSWDRLEPAPHTFEPGYLAYNDALVNTYASRRFSIDITITKRVPVWARDTTQAQPCTGANWRDERRPKGTVVFHDFMAELAQHFKDRVIAYEVWNEPQLGCKFPGTAADFRSRVLAPGYDGVKSVQPNAIVLGPAVGADHNVLDNWYTYPKNGTRYLVRPVAAVNVHAYGTLSDVTARMDLAHGYRRCMEDGSYCVSRYWLTEYGFNETDPVGWSAQVLAHCAAQDDCIRAMYYSAADSGVDQNGNPYGSLPLLNPTTLQPHAKYDAIKKWILAREPALP